MSVYTIKQLELVSGIKAHTIRMWEKRYGIFSPNRTKTNIRRYTDLDVQLILNVSLLTKNGYRISKVAKKSLKEISGLVLQIIAQKTPPEKNNLEPLVKAMLSFNQTDFRHYINKSINEFGLEKTFEDIFTPLLHRIGNLWQTGMIDSVHEHFVSNIIKHTIIHQTELLKEPKSKAPLIIYFLPEGEFHEIGLLFYTYIGKKLGYCPLYLGQSTPAGDVIKMVKSYKPAILFTSVSTSINNSNHFDFLKNLSKSAAGSHLFVTGHLVNKDKNSIPKNIHVVSSVDLFKTKLASLKLK
jgi:methanogenic corrinoid protein MtbC1